MGLLKVTDYIDLVVVIRDLRTAGYCQIETSTTNSSMDPKRSHCH